MNREIYKILFFFFIGEEIINIYVIVYVFYININKN